MADDATHHRRRDELRVTALISLVATYRRIKGIDELQPLPKGLTFDGLVEAILDHEESAGNCTDANR